MGSGQGVASKGKSDDVHVAKATTTDARTLADVEAENEILRREIAELEQHAQHYYASSDAVLGERLDARIPEKGNSGLHCLRMVKDQHELDCSERLNTSSYVNVFFEAEELQAADLGLMINLADQTVYPQSFKVHNIVLNMVANLWHCPRPHDFEQCGAYAGAGTVGSTEACLLAGLCMKFRWRKWYAERHGLTEAQARREYPNLVISTLFQACWEKFFRYMDVEPKFIKPSSKTFTITAQQVREQVNDHTIGVVCILGNHYGGQYDPVWEIDAELQKINAENDWQVGIHVDAASGGFIAPFQPSMPAWDFRLPMVLSISASGHKFGESCCGTGWVVWRQREELSEHVAISVSYLGGHADSYTLNFSRPASGIYVQYYKFHRLGIKGYQSLCDNRMSNAKYLRDTLQLLKFQGQPRFLILDAGDSNCLPVVAAYLNPALGLPYDDIDFQHAVQQYHWYVSGYKMSYNDPETEGKVGLFSDEEGEQTMFRVVVKANVTRPMIDHLLDSIASALKELDELGSGFRLRHSQVKGTMHGHRVVC